ncbi:MAG: hypothetical protein PHY59_05440 [Methanobacterium sp.]|nr:hypothetical protein [Methanobacterium sp.]
MSNINKWTISSSRGGTIRIYADGDTRVPSTWIKSSANIVDCTFMYNKGNNGAAIGNCGDLTLTNCLFQHNTGQNGGALYSGSRFNNFPIYVHINNCTFDHNTLTYSRYGGAIYNNDKSTMWITRSLFTNNVGDNGGAVNNSAMGNMTITYCTFQNNTGDWGADVVFYGDKENQTYNIANYNKFLSNGTYGAVYTSKNAPSDLRWNYWGTNKDPWKTGKITVEFGQEQGLMTYDPWVILTVKPDTKTIYNTKKTTVTDLNHLSNGEQLTEPLPDGTLTLNIPWGSFSNTNTIHSITLNTINGIASTTFYAKEGAINPLYNPVQVTVNAVNDITIENESAYVSIKKSADIHINITSDKKHPKPNETMKLTYKMGNKGPDTADNVTVTIPLPKWFNVK